MNSAGYNRLLGTFFGAGKLPWCPGTWGSLAGLAFFILLKEFLLLRVVLFLFFFFAGRVAAARISEDTGDDDPQSVVIDEVAGIFIALLFLPPNFNLILSGFILFRVFDIFKIPPAKRLERLGNGWGVMLDDILSGVYVNLILQVSLFTGLF